MNPSIELQDQEMSKRILFKLIYSPQINSYKKLSSAINKDINEEESAEINKKNKDKSKVVNKYLSLLYKLGWLKREGIRRKYNYFVNKEKFSTYFEKQLFNPPIMELVTLSEEKLTELTNEYLLFILEDQNENSFYAFDLFQLNNMFIDEYLISVEAKEKKKDSDTYLTLYTYRSSMTSGWVMKKETQPINQYLVEKTTRETLKKTKNNN